MSNYFFRIPLISKAIRKTLCAFLIYKIWKVIALQRSDTNSNIPWLYMRMHLSKTLQKINIILISELYQFDRWKKLYLILIYFLIITFKMSIFSCTYKSLIITPLRIVYLYPLFISRAFILIYDNHILIILLIFIFVLCIIFILLFAF